ncbi:MAG TPA: hypothetical protein ENH19_01595, partial [Actinobacteria bacterium]|nr:hypothetical protein [Actinomycetes bacterium]HEX21331.1 hypothetical protein [Actinomycetota bacterium]
MGQVILRFFHSVFFLILAAIVSALLAVILLGQATYRVDGLTVSLNVAPSLKGITEVDIPPVGTISAKTHKAPVKLEVGVVRMSLGGLKKLADSSVTKRELFSRAEQQATTAVKLFILKLLLIAAAAALLTGLALKADRNIFKVWPRILLGILSAVLVVGALMAATYFTFDYQAFRSPKYTGALTAAPWLISNIEDKLNTLDTFRGEVKKIATNLSNFYTQVENLDPGFNTDGMIRVVHVSDIHNNPVGLQLVKQVAKEFHADFVIDTGDITDFGTPIEARMAAKVKELNIPYVFVPGNHDSPQLMEEMKKIDNVKVLDNSSVTIDGINIFGYPDPFSATALTQQSQSSDMTAKYSADLRSIYKKLPKKPDIVAIHNPQDAAGIVGRAKLVLSGHTHKSLIMEKKKTILENAGTTGAAGLRNFKVRAGAPYTLKLLYFQKDPVKLVAIDSITIRGVQREFVLERTYFGTSKKDSSKEPTKNP